MPATVTLRPRRVTDDGLLELGERIGRLARAQALHVEDGAIVLTYDHKNQAEAKADAHMACLLLLGDRWSETVELVE